MSAERWRRVQELFLAALELPPDERAAFLDDAADPALRREVEELIAADGGGSGLLDDRDSVVGLLADHLLRREAGALSLRGRRLGPYAVVRMLGRGGMGAVYLAEREDVGLRCALKVVRGGLGAPEAVDRFLFERRLLARLEHPNIARLLDAGVTEDGTPWFAMELVEGDPIDRYCDSRRLSVAERIRLVERLCDAVSFAHRNLIVHRDLKPGNVLVTADGVPKLVDFGIAKLLGEKEEGLTGTGLRLLTPGYAAPEQLAGDPITTATDVYGLGLILYELLCGRKAYAAERRPERRPPDAPPLRPSAALTRAAPEAPRDPAEAPPRAAEEVAGERSTTPSALRRALTGDLDAIVLRALAPEPERRYPTVAALKEDLERHRRGLPVLARPDTWVYRARRFVARHRVPVGVAALLVALLSAFAGAITVQQAETARARDRAEAEAAKASQVSDFLVQLFDVADPFSLSAIRADSVTVRDFLLQRGEKVMELEGQPEVQLQALNVVGKMYFSLGIYDRAEPLYERALALGRRLYPEGSDERIETLVNLGDLYRVRDDFARGEPRYREALEMARALRAGPHPGLAAALNGYGELLRQRGDYARAEPLLREALAVRRQLSGARTPEVADALNNLGLLLWAKGDHAGAEPLLEEALSIHRERLPRVHPMTSAVLNNLALVRKARGDLAGAEGPMRESLEIKRELFGRFHWRIANGLSNMAGLLLAMGRPAEAESYAREALEITAAAFDGEHMLIGVALGHLADAREQQGDLEGAERRYRESVAAFRRALPAGHDRIAGSELALARFLIGRGRAAEARPLLESALAVFRDESNPDPVRAARAEAYLGAALLASGDRAEAAAPLARALSRFSAHPPLTPAERDAVRELARSYDELADPARADAARALLAAATPGEREAAPAR